MVDFPAAGHDQGIVGVLTTVAPGATIESVRVNDRSRPGSPTCRPLGRSPRRCARCRSPTIRICSINAFGTAACNLNPAAVGGAVLQPIGMEAVVEVVDRFDPFKAGGMLIVASAGNEATTRPHYPAAFPSVLSVGALDGTVDSDLSPWSSPSKTAPVADFSNRGSTVDVYALGVDLPTTHVNGYRFETGGRPHRGQGTRQRHIVRRAEDGRVHRRSDVDERAPGTSRTRLLIADGTAPLPQCGTTTVEQGKAVVLSSLTASITDPPIPANPITC